MTEYRKDPKTGAVHLISPSPGYEFTYCGRDVTADDEGGFEGETAAAPATCAECFDAVSAHRAAQHGARWHIVPEHERATG